MPNKTVFYRTPTTNTIPTFKLLHGGLAQYLQVLTDGGFSGSSPADQVDIFRDAANTSVFAHLVTAARWDTEIAAAATNVPSTNVIDTTIADLSTQIPYLELEVGGRTIGSPIGTGHTGPGLGPTRELLAGATLDISGTVPATPFDVDTLTRPNGADAAGRLANTYIFQSGPEWTLTAQEPSTFPGNRNFSGRCTVSSFATLSSGDVLTFGALTAAETTDYTAETSDAVTATNLAAFIDTQVGFSAYATAAVVTVVQEDQGAAAIWSVVSVGGELVIDGSGNLIANTITPDSNDAEGVVNFAAANETDVFTGEVIHTQYPLYRIRREQQKINTTSTIDWYLVTEPYWTLLLSL